MYKEAKYMICEETEYRPILDDLSSLSIDTPDWNELVDVWTRERGSVVFASRDSTHSVHKSFIDPITFTSSDRLLCMFMLWS